MQSLKLFVLIPLPINQTDKIVGEQKESREGSSRRCIQDSIWHFKKEKKRKHPLNFTIFQLDFSFSELIMNREERLHLQRDKGLRIYFMTLVSFYYLHHFFFFVINTRCLMWGENEWLSLEEPKVLAKNLPAGFCKRAVVCASPMSMWPRVAKQ